MALKTIFSLVADLLDPPAWQPAGRELLPHQQPPPGGDWSLFLLEGGRGSGKTFACMACLAAFMRRAPASGGGSSPPPSPTPWKAAWRAPAGF